MKTVYLFLLSMLLLGACATRQPLKTTALLRWTGPLAADGCGFFLEFNGNAYKPANEDLIPREFQEYAPRTVRISYEFIEDGGEYSCGMQAQRYPIRLRLISLEAEE
jgi:hypothetical protein